MIRKVSDIMINDFITVDWTCGVASIKNIVLEKGVDSFIVIENDKIVGIITDNELIKTHPNRIAADAMSTDYMCISKNTAIWAAKKLFDEENIKLLLVEHNKKVIGIITETLLKIELSRHIDLLTGLHKNDYIYYNALELVKRGENLSIIFFDVNNFGYIDKKFGHVLGDSILKKIAELIDKNKPRGTYLCRFGGDEFMILSSLNIEKCTYYTKQILQIIKANEFQNNIPVTVSAGITVKEYGKYNYNNINTCISELVNCASLASTKAKKEGCGITVINELDINEIA